MNASTETLLDVIRIIEDRCNASLFVDTERDSAPFVIERGNLQSIERAAASLGFRIQRGEREFELRQITRPTKFRTRVAPSNAVSTSSSVEST